jgi:thiamine monophosphate synthase
MASNSLALARLNQALVNRRLVKVIAGIENHDLDHVLEVVRAAGAAGAQAVDVAADPAIVSAVREASDLVVFASAIEPTELARAVEAGAHVVELGNFDGLYRRGQFPTASQILAWTRETRALIGDRAPLCVTISGRLPLAVQLDLARDLQAAGADLIQAEGVLGLAEGSGIHASLTAITSALANAAEIARVVEIPVILAGGLNAENVAFAHATGACGVGVGRSISGAGDLEAMTRTARAVVESLARYEHAGPALRLA